jgi:hypothetical protein
LKYWLRYQLSNYWNIIRIVYITYKQVNPRTWGSVRFLHIALGVLLFMGTRGSVLKSYIHLAQEAPSTKL